MLFIGKLTISMAMFNSKLLINYKSITDLLPVLRSQILAQVLATAAEIQAFGFDVL